MSMHYVRRRCSCATAPLSGYRDSYQRPPVDEICPGGIDEEMSSEATVLLQESEPEDEFQSFLYDQSGHLLDARLREQSYRMAGQNSFDSFSTAATVPLQRPVVNVQLPSDVIQREMFRRRRGPALSWGFQQEMADYEASLQNSLRTGGMIYQHPAAPCVIRSDPSMTSRQSRRRSKCETKDQRMEGSTEVANERKPVNPQPKQTKTRRRGRRGGRGRKHAERPSDDVPKLEQNLEDELAKEMANHMTSKSALAHSFSSLRLHVAGGGTMIILNDKEITGGQSHHSKQNARERDEAAVRVDVYPSRDGEQEVHIEGGPKIMRPKGCGAFFPPQVLQQLQGEALSMQTPSLSHPSTPSALNIRAMPYAPSESAPSTERTTVLSSRAKPGTGCFIPAYSQDMPSPEMDTSKDLESVSLVESLACLEDSEEADPSPEASADLFVGGDVASRISTMTEKGNKGLSPEDGLSSPHDLMHLIEADDYKTFTSPLHLDDTMSLQAEKDARDETEQKLINLQIENDELRSTIRDQREIEDQLQRMKGHNAALQIMLMMQLNKFRKLNLRSHTPLGLLKKKIDIPEENPPSKIEDEEPIKVMKRPKSQSKGVIQRPNEVKKPAKKASAKSDVAVDVRPVSRADVSKRIQVKGQLQSSENVSEVRKKKTGSNKTAVRPMRASSSLRP